jgi:predicted transglutaminase-like cysteine proteinase
MLPCTSFWGPALAATNGDVLRQNVVTLSQLDTTGRRVGATVLALLLMLLLVRALTWSDALQAWSADRLVQSAQRHGPLAVDGAMQLRDLIRSSAGQAEVARLSTMNDFFNRRILFVDDLDLWGQLDYWASPLETLGRGRGDCEDYAIAKYFALQAAGVPVHKMRLVYVRATVAGQVIPHLVLAYYATPASDPLVLDNLTPELRSASQRPDLVPVLSFNGQGLWDGVNGPSAGDPLVRLSKWRDAVAKARAEGFD